MMQKFYCLNVLLEYLRCEHRSVYSIYVRPQFSLTLSLDHLFVASYISVKRWPSDKVKESCETNLKVHCIMQLSLGYKVFRAVIVYT